MEQIERRVWHWKVIMFTGEKLYESRDEMVTSEKLSEEARQKNKTHCIKAIIQMFKQPGYIL